MCTLGEFFPSSWPSLMRAVHITRPTAEVFQWYGHIIIQVQGVNFFETKHVWSHQYFYNISKSKSQGTGCMYMFSWCHQFILCDVPCTVWPHPQYSLTYHSQSVRQFVSWKWSWKNQMVVQTLIIHFAFLREAAEISLSKLYHMFNKFPPRKPECNPCLFYIEFYFNFLVKFTNWNRPIAPLECVFILVSCNR